MGKIYDVAVIGAGPAGISCAIQLQRLGIEPLIFEKNSIGGLLRNANCVENYPGFSEGISGFELTAKMSVHLEKNGLKPVFREIHRVDYDGKVFLLQSGDFSYKARVLVVAAGTMPKNPNVKIRPEAEKLIYYEACRFFEQEITAKKIIIIGSGDAAFDYALNLSENSAAGGVVILNRTSGTKCLGILKQKVLNNNKISYIENWEPLEIVNKSEKLTVISNNNRKINADYLLFAIGREACTNFLSKELTENTDELKNKKKLFFIGDVKNGIFRQTAIAAGDGIKAAMEIHRYFSNQG